MNPGLTPKQLAAALARDPAELSEEMLVAHIEELTGIVTFADQAARDARQARVDAFRAGREREPMVKQKPMAEAAGMTEGGLIAALRKDEERRAAAG